jgi:hypothetical protein
MAEGNGTGRLDRIEALLEIVGERLNKLEERQCAFQVIQERDHDEFARDHKQLITWQVLMQDKMGEVRRRTRCGTQTPRYALGEHR